MTSLLSRRTMFSNDFNFFWTCLFLLLPASSFILIRNLFTHSAISCYVPAHLTTTMGHFIHEDCWNKDQYTPAFPIPSKNISEAEIVGNKPSVTSPHVWFPYLLFVLVLVFTVPQGLCVLVRKSLDYQKSQLAQNVTERNLAAELSLRIEELSTQKLRTLSLIFVKFVVVLNVWIQLFYFLMMFRDEFRTSTYITASGNELKYNYTDQAFPKSVLCEVKLRYRSTTYEYKIQCGLPINELYQYYTILLCLWYGLIGFVSLTHLVCLCCFCFRSSCTKGIFAKVLPKEDIQGVLKVIQGTDGLILLWSIYRKEDLTVLRDVVQLLQGALKVPSKDDNLADFGKDALPEIVVQDQDGEVDVPMIDEKA